MIILDTCLKHDTDKEMLKAFMYGQIHGKYKLYKDLESGLLSIRFDEEADATVFKLKTLDEIFDAEFGKTRNFNNDLLNRMQLDSYINGMKNHQHTTLFK